MSLVTSHSSTCLSFGISLGRKKGQHLRIVVSIKMWMGFSSPFSPTLSITVIVHSVEHIKENSWLSTFFFLLCEREMHTVVWMVRNWRKSPKEEIKEFSPGHQTAAFLKGAGTTPWKCLELFNCCCSYCFLLHTSLNSVIDSQHKCVHRRTLKSQSVSNDNNSSPITALKFQSMVLFPFWALQPMRIT